MSNRNLTQKLIFASLFALLGAGCAPKSEKRVFVDSKNISATKQSTYLDKYDSGETFVIDLTDNSKNTELVDLMKVLGGLGFGSSKTVILKKGADGNPNYLVSNDSFTPESLEPLLQKFEAPTIGAAVANYTTESETLSPTSAETSLSKVNTSSQLETKPPENPETASSDTIPQLLEPRESFNTATVTLFSKNISCDMSQFLLGFLIPPSKKDLCNGRASVQLNYKVSLLNTKIPGGTNTKDGKYLIVALSPQKEGGPGWHLTDNLAQQSTSPSLFGVRADFIGPFANKYHFWVKNSVNYGNSHADVKLVETFPLNDNIQSTITNSSNVSAQVSGSVSGQLSLTGGAQAGGQVGGQVGGQAGGSGYVQNTTTVGTSNTNAFEVNGQASGQASAQASGQVSAQVSGSGTVGVSGSLDGNLGQNNGRNVSYNSNAFTIENNSTINNAQWVWDAKMEGNRICDLLTKRDLNMCFGTFPLFDTGWIIDRNKIPAISYKSFTPTLQAIYKASPETTGTSVFEIGSNVEAGVLLGHAALFTRPALITNQPATFEDAKSIPGTANYTINQQPSHINVQPPKLNAVHPPKLNVSNPHAKKANEKDTYALNVPDGQPVTLVPPPTPIAPININNNPSITPSPQPDILKLTASMKTQKIAPTGITQSFSIDWESPYFAPEKNIRLQAIPANVTESLNPMCLNANMDTLKVTLEPCAASSSAKRSQVWGYDPVEKHYKSRVKNNYCLTYPNYGNVETTVAKINNDEYKNNLLEIQPCTTWQANQKWKSVKKSPSNTLTTEFNISKYINYANTTVYDTVSAKNIKVDYTSMYGSDGNTKKFEELEASL